MIGSEEEARAFCADRLDKVGVENLELYAAMLVEENERQNLVSASSLASVWQRHFADSLQILDLCPNRTGPILDLGSGAGLPGIVLAIANRDAEIVLVESRKKRAEWLTLLTERFTLSSCRVIGTRLETVESFDASIIMARAFAPLGKLLRLSARFSTPATVWLLPKGRSAAQELAQQPSNLREMFHVEPSVTDPGGGILVGKGKPNFA